MNAGILTTRPADFRWHGRKCEEMFRKRNEWTLARSVKNVLRMAVFFLVIVAGIGTAPYVSANAATIPRFALAGNGHNGNGKHNKNAITINSPTFNHGMQHASNSNVGGVYNVQRAICRAKVRHCKIVQKIRMNR